MINKFYLQEELQNIPLKDLLSEEEYALYLKEIAPLLEEFDNAFSAVSSNIS